METDPITRALVGEELGRHDSAAAWTLENPLDWAFFCARLPDEGAEEIYSGGADILIAAQFGRPLTATSTDGGYRISGRAPFVSNCYDADWMSSTVLVRLKVCCILVDAKGVSRLYRPVVRRVDAIALVVAMLLALVAVAIVNRPLQLWLRSLWLLLRSALGR